MFWKKIRSRKKINADFDSSFSELASALEDYKESYVLAETYIKNKKNISLSESDREEIQRKTTKINALQALLDKSIASLERTSTEEINTANKALHTHLQKLSQSTQSKLDQAYYEHKKRNDKEEASFAKQQDENKEEYRQQTESLNKEIKDLIKTNVYSFSSFGDINWNNYAPRIKADSDFYPIKIGNVVQDQESELNTLPLVVDIIHNKNLIITSSSNDIELVDQLLEQITLRLMLTVPLGRLEIILFDPLNNGKSIAKFLEVQLSEAGKKEIIDPRVWTRSDEIKKRLTDVSDHIVKVTQTKLNLEYKNIKEYNENNSLFPVPYKLVVFLNYPEKVDQKIFEEMTTILRTGPKSGVYTLISQNKKIPSYADKFDATKLRGINAQFVDYANISKRFSLCIDGKKLSFLIENMPSNEVLRKIFNSISNTLADLDNRLLPFSKISPLKNLLWSRKAFDSIRVPLGMATNDELISLEFNTESQVHGIITGTTGTGKTNLLHVIISNLGLYYSPSEVALYLIDFKQGIEFQPYAKHKMPHARVIAIESEPEFGLSVLRGLKKEMEERGRLFRKEEVRDYVQYRKSGKELPQIILIADEYQVFFAGDRKLNTEVSKIIHDLIRQGRGFGIHVLLASQNLYSLGDVDFSGDKSLSNIAVRIALANSPREMNKVLGLDKVDSLSPKGEAIYSGVRGKPENNKKFQIAYISPEDILTQLKTINNEYKKLFVGAENNPIVFNGQSVPLLKDVLLQQNFTQIPKDEFPSVVIGDSVSMDPLIEIPLTPSAGNNILLVGKSEDYAQWVTSSILISLIAQFPDAEISFVNFASLNQDNHPFFEKIIRILPNQSAILQTRDIPTHLFEITKSIKLDEGKRSSGISVLVVFGLQQLRDMNAPNLISRKDEELYQDFIEIIRKGPEVGHHVIVWCDTVANLSKKINTRNQQDLEEFTHRILFKMTEPESSKLCKTDAAHKMRANVPRGIYYNSYTEVATKFFPYKTPEINWIEEYFSPE